MLPKLIDNLGKEHELLQLANRSEVYTDELYAARACKKKKHTLTQEMFSALCPVVLHQSPATNSHKSCG
ncbi:hypothetical protein Y032_0045g1176 [Ancylostoma ceylanicum]|uniref:Uncharacterized protein n=1 Tax=Ancylostoma ceylanicum TaxID=53326 RepID=A0A016UDG2_9BILA|nr:hypothetical protein Y032_0045g1176 [Ancylostoma ceylanicum]